MPTHDNILKVLSAGSLLLISASCSKAPPATTGGAASATTAQFNNETAKLHDYSDPRTFADADKGLIAAPTGTITGNEGKVVWDFAGFDFVTGPRPDTVHPGLWRQAQLNNRVGLFKVMEGIYQLRGFDLANMTLIAGKTGWIVVDPLTSSETSRYALKFALEHLGDKPVSALLFTHSHVDHFGGALGVLTAEDAKARGVPIIAPTGFMHEATRENVLVTAMARRADYMFGGRLPRSVTGTVDNGLGKAVASTGTVGILEPNTLITQRTQELMVDDVRMIFHNVPGSEAPAEFTFSLPQIKAYCGAEMLSHTMHNLYTLRGAKVRDSLKWSNYVQDAIDDLGDTEVYFGSHHWPVWGKERIRDFMVKQRDVYAFIHDQTVRHMNQGLVGEEIAERVKLPPSLGAFLNVHGYYGSLKHNIRAVYQFYLGWFDANPANLDPLPRGETAKRYVMLAGGAAKLLTRAQASYDEGDYRWSAELLKHLVFADPKNSAGRELLAKSLEQMGYVAESAPWRNFYLTGAYELRNGPPKVGINKETLMAMLTHTPIERFLEAMAASLNAEKAADSNLRVNLVFTDLRTSYVLWIENAVLHFSQRAADAAANATLTLSKDAFLTLVTGQANGKDLLFSDAYQIDGSKVDLGRFFGLLDKASGTFDIVAPTP